MPSQLARRHGCPAMMFSAALVLWVAGCSGDDDDDTGATAGTSGSASASGSSGSGSGAADAEAFGSFMIEYQEALAGAAAQAKVSGQLFDAATTAVTSKLDTESGDCSLLVPDFPACGACEGVCVADGDCQPAPLP